MTRNEILEAAGQFYKPETITEREVAFARHMMAYEREQCAKIAWNMEPNDNGPIEAAIRARSKP